MCDLGGDKIDWRPAFCRTRMVISFMRLVPHVVVLFTLKRNDVFLRDITRWSEIYFSLTPRTLPEFAATFVYFMTFTPEFRNVFYLRLHRKTILLRWLCRPLSNLKIQAITIGPGLFIQHGDGTFISAQKIGANLWVNQQVAIGYSNGADLPIIGDNVRISAGAKVLGGVSVGDNVVVGPNTVVLDDVSANCTVLGVPARAIFKK
jgi:serine O-acetyltransferase